MKAHQIEPGLCYEAAPNGFRQPDRLQVIRIEEGAYVVQDASGSVGSIPASQFERWAHRQVDALDFDIDPEFGPGEPSPFLLQKAG